MSPSLGMEDGRGMISFARSQSYALIPNPEGLDVSLMYHPTGNFSLNDASHAVYYSVLSGGKIIW
jgi:hypothetical protein